MESLLPFFLILLASLFFARVFKRLHLPWVTALIFTGIVLGPHVLGLIGEDPVIDFLGQIGLVFLMFMAGLETRISDMRGFGKQLSSIALLNGGLPFLAGVGIALAFGYELKTALLLGIIFISSSIAVVIPALESNNLFHLRIGKIIIGNTVIQDIVSLVLLSLFVQSSADTAHVPLPIFYSILFIAVLGLRIILPRAMDVLIGETSHEQDQYEQETRIAFAAIIGTVIIFELLGLHPIIAGFFAGMVLSESLKSDRLKTKLHAVSYGVYIPVFFVIVGTKIDLANFAEASETLVFTLALVLAAVFAKLLSGYLAGLIHGFSRMERYLLAIASTPQLSTTLAAAFAGLSLGLLDGRIISALIILSMVSTLFSTIAIEPIAKRALD